MQGEAKTAKSTAGAKAPATKRSRPRAALDHRSVEQRLTDALAQQAATSEILRVMAMSPADVQPVMNAVSREAAHLCHAHVARILVADGAQLIPLADYQFHGGAEIAKLPVPLQRTSISGRAIIDRVTIHHADVVSLLDTEYPAARHNAMEGGMRTVLAVPLMRQGEALGALFLWRREPELFTPEQVTLVETFATQAAIAIENVRLFHATQEALEQQRATGEILRVISGSPTDVQPVFETIVRSVRGLCGATFSGVYLLEREMLILAAAEGMSPEKLAAFAAGYPRKIGPDTVSGRAALECRVVQTPDLISDPAFSASPGSRVGARTVLGVPMMRGDCAIGAIGVWRAEVIPFSDAQIALLQTFADQAVIAIENVRLFKELETRNRDLTEALEQQTATSEVLRVISQSQKDVQPIFDAISKAARKLCLATSSNVFTFDGEMVHVAAVTSDSQDLVDVLNNFFPQPPSRATCVLRAILTCSVVTIEDVLDDPEYMIGGPSAAGGFRSIMAVPLMREGKAIGGITVGRARPGPFPESQITLLKTFADQAVIAIENVRLFKELETRTKALTRSVGELKALGDVGQAVSSTLDLETVLSTIVSRATQLAGMDGGQIYEYDESSEEFYLHTAEHLPDDLVAALRSAPIRKGEGALGRMAITREPVQIHDIRDGEHYQSRVREQLVRLGLRSLLVVPLLRDNHLLGGLSVSRKVAGEFDADVIQLLKTFATQSALAIQNARLFREIEVKSRQLETASQHKSEFLANMSHELRTPLNAIIGFSEVLSERLFGDMNDKQSEYVRDITESGRHLLSLINEILDLSKIEAGRMELDLADFDLATTVDSTLSLVRERAQRRGIALNSTVDAGVTTVNADERKVKQVLLNLLSNALKFTPEGGAINVRVHPNASDVEIAVKDTGVGIATEEQDSVFEEFRQVGSAAKKIEGTGLGLAISRKFVELHGGSIGVTSQLGAGSTFAFTLPRRQ